jgi:hypothetical protein
MPSAAASSRRAGRGRRAQGPIQRLWLAWTDEADADGLTDFYGLQAMSARAMFEAGECFLRFRPRRPDDGLSVPLQLQMLSSEHLPLGKCETLPNGNEIIFGIELDWIGRRVAYHFHRTHPATSASGCGELVRCRRIRSARVPPDRRGQIRACLGGAGHGPALALDQYDDAELDRKKVAAMFAGFVTRPGPDDVMGEDSAQKDADGAALIGLQPGTMQLLLPGEDIKFSDPADVGGSYEAFQYRTLLACCSAMGVPYTNVTGDLRQANYSSLREGKLEFRRRIEQFQHGTLVFQLCRPAGSAGRDAVLRRARLPGFASRPGAVPRGQVDPAEVGLGRSAEGPQGRDRGDRGGPQVPVRRHRERGLRRRGGRPAHRRRPCARGGAGAEVRPAATAAEPASRSIPRSERPTRARSKRLKRWYDFAPRKGAEIVIYDEIGAFGIPAKAFLDELKALGPVAELTVRINSPGGSVFDGVAIYNALKRHDAAITVWVDGIAASIASMIAMAGDEVIMPENAMLMLHDPRARAGTARTCGPWPRPRQDEGQHGRAYRDKSGRDDARSRPDGRRDLALGGRPWTSAWPIGSSSRSDGRALRPLPLPQPRRSSRRSSRPVRRRTYV